MPTGFELIKQQVETKKLGEELPIVGWFHFPLADPVADDFYAETHNVGVNGVLRLDAKAAAASK